MDYGTEIAKGILQDLYREGFVETIYNTQQEKHRQGWTLKSGIWSPWYLNLRPLGDSPRLANDIACAMNHMIRDKVPSLTQITGIEMAGVPLVSAIGTAQGPDCQFIRYSYTRPIPGAKKPRKLEEAVKLLDEMKIEFGYGGKDLVEGRFNDGEVVCITDDMVTTFGSKLIAKHILEYELKGRGVKDVNLDHVVVVLDREQGAEEEARGHGMNLHSLIKFKTHGLEWLKDAMIQEEHQLITDYQSDPKKYMDKKLQAEAIAKASELRR